MQDLRDAFRALKATPVVTLVAILSLALGIGANTAIFSILDSLMLRTLPVKEPQRLVLLGEGDAARTSWTNPIWEQVRERQRLFDGAFVWWSTRFNLAQGGPTELVDGLWASGGLFDVLGVPAILGRTFTEADDRRGGGPDGPVAVISYNFWQRRFGGAADAIGRSLTVERVPFTIVGVAPPDFFGVDVGRTFDVAIPIGTEPLIRGKESSLDGRSYWWLNVMIRLKAGQSLEAANSAIRGVQPQIREATMPQDWRPQDKDGYLKEGFSLIPAATGGSGLRQRYRLPLTTIMVVVGLVLLIACANIANLLLARATARRHELSVRVALGASRMRIARQLLSESLLLSGMGAAIGLLFAQWGSRLLVRQLSTSTNTVFLDLSLDWRVLGFTAGVAIATAVLFGMAPALRGTRVQPNDALKSQGRGVVGDGRLGLGNVLVVLQVALSLVLIVAAGLFVRTFSSLASLNPGFDRRPILVASLNAQRAQLEPNAAAGAVPARAGSGRRRPRCRQRRPVGGDAGQRQHLEQSDRTAGWTSALGAGARHVHQPRERRLVRHLRHADDRRPRLHARRYDGIRPRRHRQRDVRAEVRVREEPGGHARAAARFRRSPDDRPPDCRVREGRSLPIAPRARAADDVHPVRAAAGAAVVHVDQRARGRRPAGAADQAARSGVDRRQPRHRDTSGRWRTR